MIALWLVAATFSASWVEITSGLRPNDDITAVGFGHNPDDILVGTSYGFVYRSRDGGGTYETIFWPSDFEVKTARPILAHAASDPSHGPGTIKLIERCGGYLYLVTPETLWRSADDGLHFERLNAGHVYWITCDSSRPGRIAVNTSEGALESRDWGDTFFRFNNPFPDGTEVNGINFRSNGRLIVSFGNMVFRERDAPAEGYDRICDFSYGDSVGSNEVSWHWWSEKDDRVVLYAVTGDGILLCDNGKVSRFTNLQFGRRPAAFVWLDWTKEGHIFVATNRDVWETWDGGATFAQVFDAPTQRSIRKISWNPDRKDDLLVATGGQLFRRVPVSEAEKHRWLPKSDQSRVDRLLAKAPLWQVVTTALERVQLEPAQIAAQRTDTTLRALMPRFRLGLAHDDGLEERQGFHVLDHPAGTRDRADNNGLEWGAYLTWDLSNLLQDDIVASRTWADVERLRALVTYRVQDTWVMWAQATTAAVVPGLSVRQRLYHELKRREAAAYLDQMTGGIFEAFAADETHR